MSASLAWFARRGERSARLPSQRARTSRSRSASASRRTRDCRRATLPDLCLDPAIRLVVRRRPEHRPWRRARGPGPRRRGGAGRRRRRGGSRRRGGRAAASRPRARSPPSVVVSSTSRDRTRRPAIVPWFADAISRSPPIVSSSTSTEIVWASTEPNTCASEVGPDTVCVITSPGDVAHRDRTRRGVELAAGVHVDHLELARRRRGIDPRIARRADRTDRSAPRRARPAGDSWAGSAVVVIRTVPSGLGTSETRSRSSVSSSGACLWVSIWIAVPS